MAGSNMEDPARVRTFGGRVSGGGAMAIAPVGSFGSMFIATLQLAMARCTPAASARPTLLAP